MSDQMIPVSDIVDPEWNSRLYTESASEIREIEDLADSMKTDGQLQSIGVEETQPSGYILVWGSRRLRAAKLNNWMTIKADVMPASDTGNRVIKNILENVKRKDLTQFEQARACVKLREVGLTAAVIGDRLGFSKQKVSNLAVSYVKMPPPILDAWRQEDPCATVDFLRELATVEGKGATPDEKEASRIENITDLWEGRKHLRERADNILNPEPKESKGKAPAKDDPAYKVPLQRYYDLVKAIQKAAPAGSKLAIESLRYAIGETNVIKGIIEPVAEEKPAKKGKKAA